MSDQNAARADEFMALYEKHATEEAAGNAADTAAVAPIAVAVVAGAGDGAQPTSRQDTFTPEESKRVLQLKDELGRKWVSIAARLPGRNANSVRNHYLRYEKNLVIAKKGLQKNRCTVCGELKRGHVCGGLQSAERASLDDHQAAHGMIAMHFGAPQ